MKPLVVVIEPIHPDGIELLERHARVDLLAGPADPRLAGALREAEAVIVRSTTFGSTELDLAPALRVIGRHGAGLDNIDTDRARHRGVAVVNTPASNTVSVAEFVIGAILMLVKRIPAAAATLAAGSLPPSAGSLPAQLTRMGLVGREVAGAHLGIVGVGAIGGEVASRAVALGMRVSGFDPYADERRFADTGVLRAAALAEMLPRCDVVSVHVPGGGGAIIGAREMALLPAGAYLINTARGDVVDHRALIDAVTSGHLAGALVDVFNPEPPAPDAAILHTEGVICTPHLAAMTGEALRRMAMDVARNVLAALGEVVRPVPLER